MFDLGFQELIVIFLVALLVFGPKKLPELGKTLGKWIIEIRKGIHNVKEQMESELEETDKNKEDSADKLTTKEKITDEDKTPPKDVEGKV